MALSIKVDTPEIPSILKMLGLGGLPAAAEDSGGTPPVDPSLAGAADPTASPDTSNAPPPEPASAPASTHDESKPPTKLLRLQQALGADQPAPAPPLQVPGPNGVPESPMPPVDLAQSLTAGQAHIKPTFRERHPNIFKTLSAINDFADEAGPGIGAPTFAQGWNAAAAQAPAKAKEELEQATGKANLAHMQAATDQMKTQVTLPNGLTVPFALAQKLYPTLMTEQGKDTRQQKTLDSKESIALRNKGLKLDENGKQVPIPYDELTPGEQGKIDLQQSQQEYAAARAQYEKTKGDPRSQAFQLAMERMKTARMNAQTAIGRLQLGNLKYKGDYLGTDANDNALPGIPLTENGTPVGIHTANITKPTSSTRAKAEQGGVIESQGKDILKQIDANPDIYGAVAGRWNEFNAGKFGNASQEVRDAYTSLKSFAALQPALHGARGIGMMHEFEDAVGSMGNDPEGLKGSIQSLLRTSAAFQKAGTIKTAPGGGAHPAATHVYDPSTGTIVPVKK
jgi:hypothetical protein